MKVPKLIKKLKEYGKNDLVQLCVQNENGNYIYLTIDEIRSITHLLPEGEPFTVAILQSNEKTSDYIGESRRKLTQKDRMILDQENKRKILNVS